MLASLLVNLVSKNCMEDKKIKIYLRFMRVSVAVLLGKLERGLSWR